MKKITTLIFFLAINILCFGLSEESFIVECIKKDIFTEEEQQKLFFSFDKSYQIAFARAPLNENRKALLLENLDSLHHKARKVFLRRSELEESEILKAKEVFPSTFFELCLTKDFTKLNYLNDEDLSAFVDWLLYHKVELSQDDIDKLFQREIPSLRRKILMNTDASFIWDEYKNELIMPSYYCHEVAKYCENIDELYSYFEKNDPICDFLEDMSKCEDNYIEIILERNDLTQEYYSKFLKVISRHAQNPIFYLKYFEDFINHQYFSEDSAKIILTDSPDVLLWLRILGSPKISKKMKFEMIHEFDIEKIKGKLCIPLDIDFDLQEQQQLLESLVGRQVLSLLSNISPEIQNKLIEAHFEEVKYALLQNPNLSNNAKVALVTTSWDRKQLETIYKRYVFSGEMYTKYKLPELMIDICIRNAYYIDDLLYLEEQNLSAIQQQNLFNELGFPNKLSLIMSENLDYHLARKLVETFFQELERIKN